MRNGFVSAGCAALAAWAVAHGAGCAAIGVSIQAITPEGEPIEGVRIAPGRVEDLTDGGTVRRGALTNRSGVARISIPAPPAVAEATRTVSLLDAAGQWWEVSVVEGAWVFSTHEPTQKALASELQVTVRQLIPDFEGRPGLDRDGVWQPALVYYVGDPATYDPAAAPMFVLMTVRE